MHVLQETILMKLQHRNNAKRKTDEVITFKNATVSQYQRVLQSKFQPVV